MKQFFHLVFCAMLVISLAGCVTVKKVTKERVDQGTAGNQGYLQGSGSSYERQSPTDREYIDVRVEIPTWDEVSKSAPKKQAKKPTVQDDAYGGNKGYLTRSNSFEDELPVASRKKEPKVYYYEETDSVAIDDDTDLVYEEETVAVVGERKAGVVIEKALYEEYKVQKGDTLSHIAKRFYGKASKWTIIYEANSDKIKDPSRLKAGIVLIIPELAEVEAAEFVK